MVDKSEQFSWLVRIGFAARGIVYILLGYIALSTRGDARGGGAAAFDYIQEVDFGHVVLWVMTVGLIAYVIFRLLCGIADIQHRGSDVIAIAKRIADLSSAAAHLFLAYACFQFATGEEKSPDENSGGQEMAGSILQADLGWIIVGGIGAGFIVGALMQARNVWTGHFMHRISAHAPRLIDPIGRIGHGARAVVFAIIGWAMINGAWVEQEERIVGLGEAVLTVRETDTGYALLAVGLIMFGLFSLATARWRIIPHFGPEGLKPHFR